MMQSGFGDVEPNLQKMEHFIRQAARSKVDVVCFPELCISGYALREEIHAVAEPVPGASTWEVKRMASEYGITVLAGLMERTEDDTVAITQVMVSPSGDLNRYRKIHLSRGEQAFFSAGSEVAVFEASGIQYGVQLCYDAHFPELSTLQALGGAEVLFMPHASPPPESAEEKRDRWLRYLSARAYDNSVFVVACNQTGDSGAGIRFAGVALVLDPRGEVIAETSGYEESMLVSELSADRFLATRSARMGFFLEHRRPEVYTPLTNPAATVAVKRGGKDCGFCEGKAPERSEDARAASNA